MERNQASTTKHKIGKVTYIVVSSPSDTAQEHLEAKVNRLLQKDLQRIAENA